jgi:hypothetical protein
VLRRERAEHHPREDVHRSPRDPAETRELNIRYDLGLLSIIIYVYYSLSFTAYSLVHCYLQLIVQIIVIKYDSLPTAVGSEKMSMLARVILV